MLYLQQDSSSGSKAVRSEGSIKRAHLPLAHPLHKPLCGILWLSLPLLLEEFKNILHNKGVTTKDNVHTIRLMKSYCEDVHVVCKSFHFHFQIKLLRLTMIMSPQIMRLVRFVKLPTKSTSAGRWFGGPVRTRHCGLKEQMREGR